MKSLLLAALAGASCLPATYNLTREGSIPIALAVVVVIGAIGGVISSVISGEKGQPGFLPLTSAFVIGVLFSEIVAFAQYYFTDGYRDPKLGVGVTVSIIEFAVISVLGGVATVVAALVKSRITLRSRATP